MRASETPMAHLVGRATSGGVLDIRYDSTTNALVSSNRVGRRMCGAA